MKYISKKDKNRYHEGSFSIILVMALYNIYVFDIFSIIYSILYAIFIFRNDASYKEKSKIITNYKLRLVESTLSITIAIIYLLAINMYYNCGNKSAIYFLHNKSLNLILLMVILFIVYFKSHKTSTKRNNFAIKYYYIITLSLFPILNLNLPLIFYLAFINVFICIILIFCKNKFDIDKMHILMLLVSVVSLNYFSTIILIDLLKEKIKN